MRLLVDDLCTTGGDEMFRGLAAFQNVEVRLFNPFCCGRQGIATKFMHETELGMLADCPALARQVIEVIAMSQRGSSYRLRLTADGVTLVWLTTTDAGEVVLTQEPEATPLMRLQNVLFGPFVPEQLL